MSDDNVMPIVVIAVVVCAFVLGLFANQAGYNKLREECRRKHNVYECELVALPKGVER